MIARCLLIACLLCLPAGAQETSPEVLADKAKEQRATMEKQLFPLLQEADEVVLYSLFPFPKAYFKDAATAANIVASMEGDSQGADPGEVAKRVADLAMKAEVFQGYPILGKVEVKADGEPAKFLSELRAAMLTREESRMAAMCFMPHHGVLVRKGEQRLRFLICFSCKQTYIVGLPETATAAGELFKHFNKDFEAFLNTRFDAAGVTRPPYKEHPPNDGK